MPKRRLAVILPVIGALILINPQASRFSTNGTQAAPVYRAFNATGAEFVESRVTGWAAVDPQPVPESRGKELVTRVASLLGASGEFTSAGNTGHNSRGYSLAGDLDANTHLLVSLASLDQTYLVVNITNRGAPDALSIWRDKVEQAFREEGVSPHLAVAITGSFPGRLSRQEMEERVDQAFGAVGTKRVEGIAEGEMVSTSGYTPAVSGPLQVAGRLINIQVALRYHATDNRTYLQVGSPLLGGEY
ncbi:hypothetical protein SY88_11815 [Clostridiales bacterium PH28_bin88]|nr:hypothetical protein SY88_11815 [Clostridiales bacterium PH28_bin88]